MPFNYTVVRSSKRKTIALHIKNAEVTIRVPTMVSQQYIDKLIKEKTPWILKKLSDSRQKILTPPPSYLPDKTLLIHGTHKRIVIAFKNKGSVTVNTENINVFIPERLKININDIVALEKQIKKLVSGWMKEETTKYLTTKLPEFSKQLKLYSTSYKVRLYKARWGSCNNKHELSFNYLLAMVPTWVFDYVIVHELCHIKYLNHSPVFWALVNKYQPSYKQASIWLKENQHHIY